MQNTPTRKYQVVEEAEIDLVLKCRDSHEFYEQYFQVFPNSKKGLESIAKIWKRRSEFAKKRPQALLQSETGAQSSHEIRALIAEQTKILSEMAALTKENLEVSRKILSALSRQNNLLLGHEEKPKDEKHISDEHHADVPKPPVQKKIPEKQAPIMVGS
ncbi:MAG TPA: hypothetical protein PKM50_05580 [Methanoregula sp.]|nr:hypothetical protein [Methanoregula sp.]